MKKQHLVYIVTALFFSLCAFIIISVDNGRYLKLFQVEDYIPMSDKIAHFTLFGMLTFLINLSLKGRTFRKWKIEWLTASFWLTIVITMEEFSQMFIPFRSFDLLDLTADYLGIALASWLIFRMKKKRQFIFA